MRNTLQEQYNSIKNGKGAKDSFLKNAKELYPNLIRNAATFDEATQILKTKSVISENIWGVVQHDSKKSPDWFKIFNENLEERKVVNSPFIVWTENDGTVKMEEINYEDELKEFIKSIPDTWDLFDNKMSALKEKNRRLGKKNSLNEAKAEEKKPTKEVVDMETRGYDYKDSKNIDNVFGEEFLKGYYAEMKDPKNAEKTVEELKQIVAKNLAKDKLHYVKDGQFGTKGVGYVEDHPGLGKPKEAKGKYKSSGYGTLKENQEQKSDKSSNFSEYSNDALTDMIINLSRFEETEELIQRVKDELARRKAKTNESYSSDNDFDGTGLIVVGRTQLDNNSIADMVDETDYYGVWNGREGYWFFPEGEETLDSLEMELEQEFNKRGIDARFEGQFNESLNEGYGMSLEDAKAEAKRISREEGVVQHVEETEEGSGKYRVSDWYDSDLTVASYENGISLSENKNPMIKLTSILNETEYYLSYKKDKKNKLKEKKETPKKVSAQVKNIEQAGNIAALEAKISAVDEEISSRETKIRMATENEDLAYFVNPEKIKETEKEIKELKKAKEKYNKMYEKLTGSKKKEIIDEKEEE